MTSFHLVLRLLRSRSQLDRVSSWYLQNSYIHEVAALYEDMQKATPRGLFVVEELARQGTLWTVGVCWQWRTER